LQLVEELASRRALRWLAKHPSRLARREIYERERKIAGPTRRPEDVTQEGEGPCHIA
jgi:hypothetical protein